MAKTPEHIDGKSYGGKHIGLVLALVLLFYWFFLRPGSGTYKLAGPVAQQLDYTHDDYGPIWGNQPFHSNTW